MGNVRLELDYQGDVSESGITIPGKVHHMSDIYAKARLFVIFPGTQITELDSLLYDANGTAVQFTEGEQTAFRRPMDARRVAQQVLDIPRSLDDAGHSCGDWKSQETRVVGRGP